MGQPSSKDEMTVRHQFDRLCQMALKGEAVNYYKHMDYRRKHEVTFSELSEKELSKLFTMDEYGTENHHFEVHGYDIEVKNTLIAEALKELTERKRNVILTKEFTTDKRKIESVAAPTVPENNTFTAYYGYDGYDTTPISGTNTELGKTATVTFEGTTSPTTEDMAVTWTIESDGGVYDKTLEAENIFRWTIPESALTNYNAANCQGYDTSTGNITGTITVKNKAATPVTITGTDSSITYTGETVDVSQYFSIDNNAGAATYTLVTGTNGGTGKGTLSGTTLTVTQTGTFKIKVSTVANGIFAAGEKTVTLTVDNGTILYTATDYSTTYDGQPHSISVSVTNPEGAAVTYSTDGITYGSDNPSFSNEGKDVNMVGSDILIYRLVYNLVENAIKYNHSGGQVSVEAYQREKQVYLSVKDTGNGIPEELKERVFEPFFRVDKSRSRELGGVGLGLALVNEIVRVHDGSIAIRPNPSGGTIIEVEFSVNRTTA